MAGSGFIGGGNNRTGEIHGTTGQVNTGIKSSGKVPVAVPAITTYQGKATKDIKVTVDNKTRIIYAELTDTYLKQKGITKIWYDLAPESPNYQWLCYSIPTNNETEKTVKVAKLPTFTDLNKVVEDITSFINSVEQRLLAKINKKERAYVKENDDDDYFTLCFTNK